MSPKAITVTIRIPEELHAILKERARAEDRSLSNMITHLLAKSLAADGKDS